MSYHTVVYNLSAAAAGATNSDMSAATDTEISQRNSHYVFTERYRMLAAALVGASVIRGRYQVPRWNAIGEATIFNANRALQPPSNPQWDSFIAYPPEVPQNEEFQVQASNNLGASTEIENCVIQLAPDDWNNNLDRGDYSFPVRASFTVTPTLNAWSGGQILTFSQSLRGGTYAILGTVVQGSNSVAWRWIFPRNRLYHGRRLRPGGLIQNAIGDSIANALPHYVFAWGTLGYFASNELPTLEVFGTAASSTTYQCFIWIAHLSDDINVLNRYVG